MVKKKFFLLGDEEKKNMTEIEGLLLSLKHFISKETRCLHANIMMPTWFVFSPNNTEMPSDRQICQEPFTSSSYMQYICRKSALNSK